MADLAPIWERPSLLAGQLRTVAPEELRALFEGLQLDIAFHPAEGALDVPLTPCDDGGFESFEGNA